jgi:hypothetical protein
MRNPVTRVAPNDREQAVLDRAGAVKTGTIATKEQAEAAARPAVSLARQGIDGAKVLDFVHAYFGHWCAYPSDEDLDTNVLWAGHAKARDDDNKPIWWATPRLIITATRRNSGKSRAEDLMCLLDGTQRLSSCTPRALTDAFTEGHIVALDEAHLVFGAGTRSVQLQTDLNGGYTRLGAAGVARKKLSTFGPVMIAGKTQLMTTGADSLNDLISRSIIVQMHPSTRPVRPIGRQTITFGEKAGQVLTAWTAENRSLLVEAEEELGQEWYDAGIINSDDDARQAEIRRPLAAVARVAGGDWPERYERCLGLTQNATEKIMAEMEAEVRQWLAEEEAAYAGE